MPVELSETTDSDGTTSKGTASTFQTAYGTTSIGTASTFHTATQQVSTSAASSSSYLEEKGGISINGE